MEPRPPGLLAPLGVTGVKVMLRQKVSLLNLGSFPFNVTECSFHHLGQKLHLHITVIKSTCSEPVESGELDGQQ